MVGGLDHLEVVLDDDHGVSVVHESVQNSEELADVLEMQACGGLVEDVESAPGRSLRQLAGELDALRLASGKRRGRLPKLDVTQPYVVAAWSCAERWVGWPRRTRTPPRRSSRAPRTTFLPL